MEKTSKGHEDVLKPLFVKLASKIFSKILGISN
jgi:hypothetical protein